MAMMWFRTGGLALASVLLLADFAMAQVLPDTAANRARGVVGCTQTTSGISCPGGGGGGGAGSYGNQQFMNQMMMSTMQGLMNNFWEGYQRGLEIRRQRQAALRLNDAGIAYGEKGNWTAAVNHFRQALNYSNDPIIRKNLAWAEDELSGRAAARRAAERKRRERIAGMIGGLADKLGRPAPDAAPTGTATAKNELDFLTPKGTAFFGQGGEAPPPVDTRDDGDGGNPPGPNGLAFMSPGNEAPPLISGDTVDLRDAPAGQGVQMGVQMASADPAAGLQFIDPDAPVSPTAAARGGADPLNAGALSPKAAILLDALAYGNRDWDRSRAYLLDLRKKYPDDANVAAALSEFDAVRAQADAAPAGPAKSVPPEVASLERQGREFIREGKFLEARDAFHKAVLIDPSQEEVHDLLNSTHMLMLTEADEYREKAREAVRAGRYAEARGHLQAVSRRVPYDKTVERQLEAIKPLDVQANAMLQMVTGQEPDPLPPVTAEAFDNARNLIAGGKYEDALDELGFAAATAPKDRRVRDEFFRVRGLADAENGTIGQRLLLYQGHPYAVDPGRGGAEVGKEVEALIDQADQAIAAGNYAKAVADLREAQSLVPGRAEMLDYLRYVQGLADFKGRR